MSGYFPSLTGFAGVLEGFFRLVSMWAGFGFALLSKFGFKFGSKFGWTLAGEWSIPGVGTLGFGSGSNDVTRISSFLVGCWEVRGGKVDVRWWLWERRGTGEGRWWREVVSENIGEGEVDEDAESWVEIEEDEVEVESETDEEEEEEEDEGEAESMEKMDGGRVKEERRETYEDVIELDNLRGDRKEEDGEIEEGWAGDRDEFKGDKAEDAGTGKGAGAICGGMEIGEGVGRLASLAAVGAFEGGDEKVWTNDMAKLLELREEAKLETGTAADSCWVDTKKEEGLEEGMEA